jgi:hypothetical protein
VFIKGKKRSLSNVSVYVYSRREPWGPSTSEQVLIKVGAISDCINQNDHIINRGVLYDCEVSNIDFLFHRRERGRTVCVCAQKYKIEIKQNFMRQ